MSGIRMAGIASLLMAFASCLQAQQLALVTRAQTPALAGHVLFAVGDVQGMTHDGLARRLSQGDVVREGETLLTGPNSHLQLRMTDDALLALRPDSRVRLHTYRFVERGGDIGRASIELLLGGLRSITGAIGRVEKQNYVIYGGKVLVGVRGTDHETFVVAAPLDHPGTYNRVTIGGTYLESARGRIDLDPLETGFAALTGDEAPRRLGRSPEFMHAAFQHAAFQQSAANFSAEMREDGLGDERRLRRGLKLGHDRKAALPEQAMRPALPAQALGENVSQQGFGKGGRCGGPCGGPKTK